MTPKEMDKWLFHKKELAYEKRFKNAKNKTLLAVSERRWQHIVDNGGRGLDNMNGCALCEKYSHPYSCGKCPLLLDREKDICCVDYPHPWALWYSAPTKENAQAVLDLIRSKMK